MAPGTKVDLDLMILNMPDEYPDGAIQVYIQWGVPATSLPMPGLAQWNIPDGKGYPPLQYDPNYIRFGYQSFARRVQSYHAIPQKNQDNPSSDISRDGVSWISLEEVAGLYMMEKHSPAINGCKYHTLKGPSNIQI